MKRASLIFPKKAGKVTLARKKKKIGVGLWNGYGGKEEPEDEGSMEKCAVREIGVESFGVVVREEDLDLVAIINFYKAGVHVFECFVYFATDWVGEFKETDEMSAPEEFDVANPPLDEMMAGDRLWLEKIFLGEKIRAQVFYNEDNSKVLDFKIKPL